jgi:signal transduction histidine kinase
MPLHLQSTYQQILAQTAHLLLQDLDVDTLCQGVFDLLREPFQLDVYFHYLLAPQGDHLELASSGGNETIRAALGSSLQFGQAVCGTVAVTCQWMYITSVQQRHDEMTSLIRSYGVRCYTCQPILVRGNLAGTLSFGSVRRDTFEPQELELFALVAQQVRAVTERRLQNEQLRKLEQLAAAGRMCATLAHEINNPLDTLTGLLHLLEGEVTDPEAREHVLLAAGQVARLAETTRRTLNQFRGRQQKPVLLNISELASDLAANISLPGSVRLRTDISPALHALAVASELQQVLFNLLLNAAQFSPAGHPVTLAVRLAPATSQPGRTILISIKDEGPGISELDRGNLFAPFFTTRKDGGTGLGLWVSREMVERVGGTLTFESNPRLRPGTEFLVTLPAA